MNLVINEHTYTVLDDSTVSAIRVELASSAELDTIRSDLTEEHCKNFSLGENTYRNMIPETMTMTSRISGPLVVTFSLREKTVTEQQAEQIKELQDSILTLTETLIETQASLEEAQAALSEAKKSADGRSTTDSAENTEPTSSETASASEEPTTEGASA